MELGTNRIVTVPNSIKLLVILIIVAALLFIFCFFSIDVTEQAVKTQFGKIVKVYKSPGPYLKAPWQKVLRLPKTILEYDVPPTNLMTRDGKMVVVDNIIVWRIKEPKLFTKSVGSISRAQILLDDVVYADVRARMGRLTFDELAILGRTEVLFEANKSARRKAASFGISLYENGIRTKRIDLPQANMPAIYERMIADREKLARRYRAEGKEQATMIRAKADMEYTRLISSATENSLLIKGDADSQATQIYATAYKKDPSFYEFLRQMDILGTSLKGNLILPKDSEVLKFLHK